MLKLAASIAMCVIVCLAVWTMIGLVWGQPAVGLGVGAALALLLYVFLFRPGMKKPVNS
jgi:hypothetical protein